VEHVREKAEGELLLQKLPNTEREGKTNINGKQLRTHNQMLFVATEFNKTLSGWQPRQAVEQRIKERCDNHLRSGHRETV
jgi:hypothetical protein